MRFTLEKEVLKVSCETFPQEKLLEVKKECSGSRSAVERKKGMETDFHQLDKV